MVEETDSADVKRSFVVRPPAHTNESKLLTLLIWTIMDS